MSLLERGNTRLAPLDTVEPDMKVAIPILGGHQVEDAYFRPKVESLLSQCRKEVWLEAAVLADAWGEARNPDNGGHALRNYANELRRMAESDKTTMEGEKSE